MCWGRRVPLFMQEYMLVNLSLTLSAVMEVLMNEICSALSRKEIYFEGPQAPSFFMIYAHDNPNYSRADDRIVKRFISYLRTIGSKAQSDRNPVIRQSPNSSSAASHDILANQFCLLPRKFAENSVDKVLLCYSEVLHAYCRDPKGKEYVERVVKAGHEKAKSLTAETTALRSKSWSSYEFRSKVLDDINRALTTEKLYTHTRYNQVESVAHANDRLAPQSGGTYTPLESKCFEKLRFKGMENRQEDVIESIDLAGTCEWISTAPEFTQWRSRHGGDQANCQLWIKGHPGTGKSVATRKVLEIVKQKEEEAGTDATVLSYFFHGRSSEPLDKNMMGMLRTLIHQLLRKEAALRSKFAQEYKEHFETQGTNWEWHKSKLTAFLLSVVTKPRSRPIHLVIDAIDECDPSEAVTEVYEFLNLMVNKANAQCDLSMCISMRHDTAISNHSGEKLEITMETRNGDDIQGHVYGKLMKEEKLAKEICDRASKNFLWAVLAVKRVQSSLGKGEGRAKAMNLARQLPKPMEDLFGELISGLDHDEKQEACILFQWALFGSQHFDPGRSHKDLRALKYVRLFAKENYPSFGRLREEHGHITIGQFSKRVKFLSGGLIEFLKDPSELSRSPFKGYVRNTTLQVIHESVKDWFLAKGCQLMDEDMSSLNVIMKSHTSLMKCLITFISASDMAEIWTENKYDSGVREVVLSASKDIFRARQVADGGQLPMDLLDCLSTESNTFWRNLQTLDPWRIRGLDGRRRYALISPLNMCCYLGHTALIRHLLGDAYWLDKVDHGTAVSAIQSGQYEILEIISESYEFPEFGNDEDNLCRIACEEWRSTLPSFAGDRRPSPYLSMVALLCQKGVRIQPLFEWLMNDWYSASRRQILDKIPKDVRIAQSISWDTAVEPLLEFIHKEIARLLKPTSPKAWGLHFQALLELNRVIVVCKQHGRQPDDLDDEAICDITMETAASFASLNHPACEGKTLSAIAATFGQYEDVETLLEKGADPTIRDNFNMTPLDHAVAKLEALPRQWLQSRGYNVLASRTSTDPVTPIPEIDPDVVLCWKYLHYPLDYQQEDFVRTVALLAAKEQRPSMAENSSDGGGL
ncbi:uncharacterized protein PG986_010393 [Apiospora aurea]|uniref:Nephrocystin 3-like N-terminal domain-containing protein n=1 Tax=Apiospora aurea TaxID=335848 RepID=A0ABR1Q2B1_9PEZI